MRRLILTAVAAAGLTYAASASAQIAISSTAPGTNPYTGPTPTYTFDPGSQPIFTGGAIETGTNSNLYAQPFGSTGDYYAVGPYPTSPGTIDLSSFGDITSMSFLWGSVDAYNTLEFLAADGTTVLATFTGNDVFNPATGDRTDPNTNPVVTFSLTGTDVSAFTYLRLTSSQNAFEIDNLAINPVPEPATWAMMLLGFGGIGLAMRRKRTTGRLAQIA